MGAGGALADGTGQVPRLTSVLRALATEGGRLPDASALSLARQPLLKARGITATAGSTANVVGNSNGGGVTTRAALQQLLLGVPDKAPRAARDDYDKFLKATSVLAGGEVGGDDLAGLAGDVWRALVGLPAPEPLPNRLPGYELRQHRAALVAASLQHLLQLPQDGPSVEGSTTSSPASGEAVRTLREAVQAVQPLKQWQRKLNPTAAAASAAAASASSAAAGGSGSNSKAAGSGSGSGGGIAKEFGSDLDFVIQDDLWLTPDQAMERLLGSRGASTSAPGPAGHFSAAAAVQPQYAPSSALEPSPAELRAMVAGGAGGSGGAAYADAGFDDDDDDEYADGKKVREVGVAWLLRWASRLTGGQSQDEAMSVATSVAIKLLQTASGAGGGADALAGPLLDLLGDGALEAITYVLDNRRALVAALRRCAQRARQEAGLDDGAEGGGAMPVYGPGATITITSESQKLMAKLARKEAKRGAKQGDAGGGGAGGGADVDTLLELGYQALLDIEVPPTSSTHVIRLAGGAELRIGTGNHGDAALRGALPKGTTRKTYKKYEEIIVPAAPKASPPAENELVAISDMPEWAQLAFEGYKSLNRIQSRIWRTGFYSNENMLVCAPTGAGKTNIAMISVLREVSANMRHGVIQRADFKVVYVAPMKALAAEVTASFAKRLEPLGLVVRELTGDMQLSKKELAETQMIVTTPEKWDVITRKGGDVSVASLVRLLIIDEVHLLNDDRGPVIETLVARTLRQVEASQSMIRIVGLSATLPNYQDVATFLRVNLNTGMFYFDASYRPVPLSLNFVGVSEPNVAARTALMNEICYNKMVESLKAGHQVMVFVHSRKDTGKSARALADLAAKSGDSTLLDTREDEKYAIYARDVSKSRNQEVVELFQYGFGIHHAGMLRADRSLTEKLFAAGLIRVLCCTATLAWGVNLPAHTVIIKGTQVYDPQKGGFNDVGMLDVQQIFGRAGRPQFEDSGLGIIITQQARLAHYLGMLTHSTPIESQFKGHLADNLNAEIVLGTVTNVREAVSWLNSTYLALRLAANPLAYGITYDDLALDPGLENHKKQLIINAAMTLKRAAMASYDERSGQLYSTDLGRVASHFYISHNTVMVLNEHLKPHMSEAQILGMISKADEFSTMMVREEELPELDTLCRSACPYDVKGGVESKEGKINGLMQAWISRARVESFSLTADMLYVSSNAPRIMRAVFEIVLRRKWSSMSEATLNMARSMELRLWPDQHPLRQFEGHGPGLLGPELLSKLESRHLGVEELVDMTAQDIGAALRHPAAGAQVKACVDALPTLELTAQLQPITRTVLRIQLGITAPFAWRDRQHGSVLRWLIWVEDPNTDYIYHQETWLLTKKMAREGEQKLAFTIPISEPLPPQYYIKATCESWHGSDMVLPVSFQGLMLPQRMPPHTELLDLDPLPVSALRNQRYESMYAGRFTHFNPIQTQAFHTLYHTDDNVLMGAPTGSGKTVTAELTMYRLWNAHQGMKVIYIAPLKALVRERIEDWGKPGGFCATLGKSMVELTGDYTPDLRALLAADIIIATPEKWDGISRQWQTRAYAKKVGLLIIDEIHLLGADRGPILEVIVSRMRYIAAQTDKPVRFVGLSTALANAQDLADWMGVPPNGLFNFKPSVRPVPLEAHIQGYPGKFYCPRMMSMNKPTYAAIQAHSPTKPVLVFVSSRRQTRLTAMDLIQYAVADERPHQFLRMSEEECEALLPRVKDQALRHCLGFGIGLHHAGLNDGDRSLVERLYVECKIQVLVATSTLAWGVNTPAHLVVIKGTEFYDAPSKRYVDFPITDVLQMMGRAGRPQFDKRGVAVIMVHEPKKQFYKKFLYEPFPVESSLAGQIPDHFNAEVVAGTIRTAQDAVDYLTWTYFFRRLVQNPSYYDLGSTDAEAVNDYMSALVSGALAQLEDSGCLVQYEKGCIEPTPAGRITSFYYLQHATTAHLTRTLAPGQEPQQLLEVLCGAHEFDELPVRHNEDKINTAMARTVRYPVDVRSADDPHVKAHLLLQAHMARLPPPISDYGTDTKMVLDNCLRLLQAMVDLAAGNGWLDTALAAINLIQATLQARWPDEPSLLTLPHIDHHAASSLERAGLAPLPVLVDALAGLPASSSQSQSQSSSSSAAARGGGGVDGGASGGGGDGSDRRAAAQAALNDLLGAQHAREVLAVVDRLPLVAVRPKTPRLVEVKTSNGDEDDDDGFGPGADGFGGGGSRGSGAAVMEQQWELEVELMRLKGSGRGGGGSGAGGAGGSGAASSRPRVYAPRYPKVKEEGWFLVAGDASTRELLALKRVALGGAPRAATTTALRLPRYNGAGEELAVVTVFLLSDSYIGMDQQYEVVLRPDAVQLQYGASRRQQQHHRPGAAAALRARRQQQQQQEAAAAGADGEGDGDDADAFYDGEEGDGRYGGAAAGGYYPSHANGGGAAAGGGAGGDNDDDDDEAFWDPEEGEEASGDTSSMATATAGTAAGAAGADALPQRAGGARRGRGGAAAATVATVVPVAIDEDDEAFWDDEPACN